MASDNQLWVPPTSSIDQERPKSRRKNGRIPFIKRIGFAEKALWDWLMLVGTLAIPIALTFATITLTQQQTLNSQAASERQHQTDLQIAANQQQTTILQTYLDRMGDLLLANKLQASKPDQAGQELARVRTLIVLPSLDAERKRVVMQFLYEANLITAGKSIVNLSGADLSGADLSGMTLINADLSGASLDLVNLDGTTITPDQLAQILNLRGATMPDGSIHP